MSHNDQWISLSNGSTIFHAHKELLAHYFPNGSYMIRYNHVNGRNYEDDGFSQSYCLVMSAETGTTKSALPTGRESISGCIALHAPQERLTFSTESDSKDYYWRDEWRSTTTYLKTNIGIITIWNFHTGERRRTFAATCAFQFSPRGNWLFAYDGNNGNNPCRVWNPWTGEMLYVIAEAYVGCSPTDRCFVTRDAEQRLTLRIPETGALIGTLAGTLIGFSPNGKFVATSVQHAPSNQWQILLHNLETAQLVAALPVPDSDIKQVVFSRNEQAIACRCGNGLIHVWAAR